MGPRRSAAISAVGGTLLLLLVAGPTGAAEPRNPPIPTNPLPEPVLEKLSPEGRAQIEEARAELAAARDADASTSVLGARYGELGAVYLLHDFSDAAAVALENARHLDPDELRWVYYLGVLRQRAGDLEGATESFRRALELAPRDVPTRLRLAEVRLDASDHEEAERHFEKVLELEPDSAAAYWGLGRIAYEEGSYREAVERLETALDLQPEATSIHHTLGLAYRQLGDLGQARSHLARNTHEPTVFGDPLMDELNRRLRGSRVLVKVGIRAVERGDLDEAARAFRAAVASDPSDSIAHYNLARVLLERGERKGALERLRRAVEIDPGYRDAHFNLGTLLMEEGRSDAAIPHFERAVEIDPRDAEARLELARALNGTGERGRAIEELELLLGEERLSSEVEIPARTLLARLYGQSGDFAAAARQYGEIVELAPSTVEAHFGRALSLLLAAEHERALAALEAGLEAAPTSVPLRHLLARVLATAPEPALRDGERAVDLALGVFEEEPTIEYAETVAMAHAAAGNFSRAIEWQRRVVGRLEQTGEPRQAAVDRLARYERGERVEAPWLER